MTLAQLLAELLQPAPVLVGIAIGLILAYVLRRHELPMQRQLDAQDYRIRGLETRTVVLEQRDRVRLGLPVLPSVAAPEAIDEEATRRVPPPSEAP